VIGVARKHDDSVKDQVLLSTGVPPANLTILLLEGDEGDSGALGPDGFNLTVFVIEAQLDRHDRKSS
jgi:hypothetical protein